MGLTEGELLSWIEGQEALASEVFLDDMYCKGFLYALYKLRNKLKEGEDETLKPKRVSNTFPRGVREENYEISDK